MDKFIDRVRESLKRAIESDDPRISVPAAQEIVKRFYYKPADSESESEG